MKTIFETLERDMDHMMKSVMHDAGLEQTTFFPIITGKYGYPKLNIAQKVDHYIIQASVPGFEKDELEIELKPESDIHVLTISGKKLSKAENAEYDFDFQEIKLSQFSRSIGLPNVTSDQVEAELKNGILNIKVQKRSAPKPDVKKIEIR